MTWSAALPPSAPLAGGAAVDDIDRAQIEIERASEQALANRPGLARLAAPSAHNCTECGDVIAEARRTAVPGCSHCPDCAADAELRQRIARGGGAW